ncbi:hypothetical protein MKW98_014972 [Papaver atlanticum]|uniref:WAT1-related protein n=1 Tax=Papaver atlanticum TaxID=357466 RepID=A0AAD4SP54_9MAGN|nr:hypothetical protein MKW98_014972 [Papaver atlanticum]
MATLKSLLPCFLMVLLQVVDGGNNVFCKLALNSGMSPSVMVAYGQIFATIILAPFAFFFERKSMATITKYVAVQMFLCSFFGATLSHVLYYAGLEHTTPTIACALLNLSPAITFILAIPFRMETITIKTNQGIAKLIGTIICVGGAMVMSFYKGSLINLGTSNLHWRYAVKVLGNRSAADESNSFVGLTLVFLGVTSWSFFPPIYNDYHVWIMCGLASIQCLFIGVLLEGYSVEAWSLTSPIRVGACLYSAAFSSALQFVVISWCISQRGLLYVSMFNPLALIVVAALGWVIMDEKLYLGSAVGAVLTVIGLYGVLWGKHQEVKNLITVKSSGPRNVNLDDGSDIKMMGDGHDKIYTGLEQVLWWNPSYDDVEEAGKINSKIALNPTMRVYLLNSQSVRKRKEKWRERREK